jgi:hypothetical protein
LALNGTTILQLPITAGIGADSDAVWLEMAQFVSGSWVSRRVTAAALATAIPAGYVPTSRQVIAGEGLSGGGALTANVTLALDVDNLNAAPAMTVDDVFAMAHQTGSNLTEKVTFPNAMKAIDGMTELAIPSFTEDFFVIYHEADGLTYKISPSALSLVTGNVPAGGLTGQVLAKISDVDYATEWTNNIVTLDGLSVAANPTTSSGASQSVTGTAAQVLRVANNGLSLAFGSIDLSQSATVGVSLLPLANGGTNAALTASNGGIFYSTATAGAILSGTATARQILLSGLSSAPAWSTATYPSATGAGEVLASAPGSPNDITSTISPTLGVQQTSQGTLTFSNTAAGAFPVTLQSSNSASAAWTLTLPTTAGTNNYVLTTNGSGVTTWTDVNASLAANRALSNLASVAINTALLPGVSDSIALGSATFQWSDLFLGTGGLINWANGNATLTHSTGLLTTNVPVTITGVATADGFAPTATTATGNRLYLPAANTLGFAINGAGELQLTATALSPITDDGLALGVVTTNRWADLFFASGAVINFNSDVTITHSSDTLAFAGASTAYTFAQGPITPVSNDAVALGTATVSWADLFLASGGLINWNNGAFTLTQATTNLAASGTLSTGVNGTLGGQITFNGATSGSSTLNVAAAAGTSNFTLPVGNGTNNFVLTTNGSGVTSWTDITSGIAANRALSNLASVAINTALLPGVSDSIALGSATFQWSDLFLGAAGVVNFDNGNATITHSAGLLTTNVAVTITGTATANTFVPTSSSAPTNGMYLPAADTLGWAIGSAAELQLTATALSPAADGGSSLGTTTLGWQNLFANTGFVLNIENGNWVATHTSGILTVGTGDLRVTNNFTNAASVVTVGGAQTLASKTLTSPVITTSPTATGATWTDLGTVTTVALATVTGAVDMGGATSLEIPNGAAPTVNADGEIAVDTTITDFANGLIKYYSGAEMAVIAVPVAELGSPQDGAVPTYNAANDQFELTVGGGGGGANTELSNLAVPTAINTSLISDTDNTDALGSATIGWSDLFLGDGGVINWNNGNATLTHSAGLLTTNVPVTITGLATADGFAPTSSTATGNRLYLPAANTLGFAINGAGEVQVTGTATSPVSNDGNALGTTALGWSDLHLATGGVINWANGEVTITETDANTLTVAGATAVSLGTSAAFTTGTIELGAASDTTISRSAAGVIAVEGVPIYSGVPINSQSTAYSTVLADAQRGILHPTADNNARTFTIDGSVSYPIGSVITFINQINTLTIGISTDTLTQAGTGSTGNRTLAASGIATAYKIASGNWIISGVGLT